MRRVSDFRATSGFADVKDTLEILDFGFKLQEAIVLSYADKKITIFDLANLFSPLMAAGAAIDGISNVKKEFAQMTLEGRKIVKDFIQERFNVSDEELEKLLIETIDEVIGDVSVGFKWAAYRKNKLS